RAVRSVHNPADQMIPGRRESRMLSDGLILALIVLLPIGFGVGAVYVLRRLRGRPLGVQRSHRGISDRERKWALIVIALVSTANIPTVLSLLPELTKAGLAGDLLIVPLLFIINISFAVAVWRKKLGLRGVVAIVALQTLRAVEYQNRQAPEQV